MISWRAFTCTLGGLALVASLPVAAQMTTKPLTPSQMVSPDLLVKRIDANCAVFHQATLSQAPTEVANINSTSWALVKTASDASKVENMHAAVTYAKVWKQAGNLVWAHWVTAAKSGATHAVQLCFRSDGTLARVRQAGTIPALEAAGSRVGYYNTDGSLIFRDAAYAIDDPMAVKKVKSLPFYSIVP